LTERRGDRGLARSGHMGRRRGARPRVPGSAPPLDFRFRT